MVLCWLITSQHHPPLTLQGLRRVLVFARYKGTPRQVAPLCPKSCRHGIPAAQSALPGLEAKPPSFLPAMQK